MRLFESLWAAAACAVCASAPAAFGQDAVDPWARNEFLPYHTHYDTHHGHDRVYPDRGAVFRDLPKGAVTVHYAGLSYHFYHGVWFESQGPAFIVVTPPVGLTVTKLSPFATRVQAGGRIYLYANDVYYQPLAGRGGFEVVNDPLDVTPESPAAPLVVRAPAVPAAPALPQMPGSPAMPAAPVQPAASMPAEALADPALATRVSATPRNGQSPDRQARDRYDCYRSAAARSGFDPMRPNGGVSPAQAPERASGYLRAQAACLEKRGYTVH